MNYNGHEIALRDDWRFEVAGDLFKGEVFESLRQAQKAVDDRISVLIKQQRKEARTEVQLLNERGAIVTCRGLNASTGRVLLVEAKQMTTYLFPAVPWIKDHLGERVRLRKRLADIDEALKPVAIESLRTLVAGRVHDSSFNLIADALDLEIARAQREAELQ